MKNVIISNREKCASIYLKRIKLSIVRENYLEMKYFGTKVVLKYGNVKGALTGGSCSDFKITDGYTEYKIREIRIANDTIALITEIPYFYINDITTIKLSYLPEDKNAIIRDNNYQTIPKWIDFSAYSPIKISPYLNTIYISQPCYFSKNVSELELNSYQTELSFNKKMCSYNIFVVSDVYKREDTDGNIIFFMFKYKCHIFFL